MTIHYEWDIETVCAESEDILDHSHRDKLSEYGADELIRAINQEAEPDKTYTRLVLVRDKREGEDLDRSWAYVTDDGKMPERFLNAYDHPVAKVPQHFIEEFNR